MRKYPATTKQARRSTTDRTLPRDTADSCTTALSAFDTNAGAMSFGTNSECKQAKHDI